MSIQKHFTVSAYIVHKDKVLLHLHKKYGMILPLGGHIEADELPEEACIREVIEESGLHIKIYDADKSTSLQNSAQPMIVKMLIRPIHMILCEVNSEHYHVDLNYYATTDTFNIKPGEEETDLLYWFTKEDLNKIDNAPQDVIMMAKEALELLSFK